MDCIKYCAEHPDSSQAEASRNLGVMAVKETAERCRKSKRPFSVAGVLAYLGISLSGYKSFLNWKLPEQKKKKVEVQQQITDIHKDFKQIYGAPKIA